MRAGTVSALALRGIGLRLGTIVAACPLMLGRRRRALSAGTISTGPVTERAMTAAAMAVAIAVSMSVAAAAAMGTAMLAFLLVTCFARGAGTLDG